MADVRKEPFNWETVWDDSEKHIDNHALRSIEYEKDEEIFRLNKGGEVKHLEAEKLLKEYYD